jgi:hypothetical protein
VSGQFSDDDYGVELVKLALGTIKDPEDYDELLWLLASLIKVLSVVQCMLYQVRTEDAAPYDHVINAMHNVIDEDRELTLKSIVEFDGRNLH